MSKHFDTFRANLAATLQGSPTHNTTGEGLSREKFQKLTHTFTSSGTEEAAMPNPESNTASTSGCEIVGPGKPSLLPIRLNHTKKSAACTAFESIYSKDEDGWWERSASETEVDDTLTEISVSCKIPTTKQTYLNVNLLVEKDSVFWIGKIKKTSFNVI